MTKVAIAHDFLAHKDGGAERVLRQLIKLYPEADILTLTFDPDRFQDLDSSKVKASWLSRLPKALKQNPKYLLFLIRSGLKSLPSKQYDLLIINSSGWTKNLAKKPGATKIVYCNSPNRLIWDSWPSYFVENLEKLSIFARPTFLLLNVYISQLRLWDYHANQDIDKLVANSSYIAKRISKYYKKSVQIIHPPVELIKNPNLKPSPQLSDRVDLSRPYFIYLGVLSRYKLVDQVVEAFKLLGDDYRLLVVGDGPEKSQLEDLAKDLDNIIFLGWVSEEDKLILLAKAKAFIFPSIEDFGITPIEALSQATPVIARNAGGLKETIKPKTGILLDLISPSSLANAIKKFDPSDFSDTLMKQVAVDYSPENFIRQFEVLTSSFDFSSLARVKIFDWMIDPITINQLLEKIKSRLDQSGQNNQPLVIIKPYVEHFNPNNFSQNEIEQLNQIGIIVPDGVALQWAGTYLTLYKPNLIDLFKSLFELISNPTKFSRVLPEKFAGNDFTLPLMRYAHKNQLKISTIGGDDPKSRVDQLNQIFGKFSHLQVLDGYYSEDQELEIIEKINKFCPDILFVATGLGKQEKFILKYHKVITAKVIVAEGGSFDYDSLGGDHKRAPAILRKHNLEWAWRLLTSPSGTSSTRLKRQLFIPRFIWRVHQESGRNS